MIQYIIWYTDDDVLYHVFHWASISDSYAPVLNFFLLVQMENYLEVKAVAVEMEDCLIPFAPDVQWPDLFCNASLEAQWSTYDDTHIHDFLLLHKQTE